ncbi:MAG: YchF/TatD family DNA exonuclease [Micromonosporaceae bacterium]|nr:YchF/TatD family DNA exonuclease [Micromonosporaceae bacterium]
MRTKKTDRSGEAPPAPEPLAAPVLDSHTHFDLQDGSDRPGGVGEALAKAEAAGVDRVVQVGIDVPSSRWAADLATEHPEVVATAALHPNEAPRLAEPDLDSALAEIDALAAQDRVRGVGETGLDYFRTGDDGRKAQHASFRAHIEIAKRHGKALVIHDRDAHADVLRILDEERAPDTVVLHCFSGDAEFAKECADRGYVMSFAGTVTFSNARGLQEAAEAAPRELILVETDAPFLTPMPYRGRPNAPYLIPLTVRFLAELRGEDLDELCGVISATGDRVFGPW